MRHLWIVFWLIATFLPVGVSIQSWTGRAFTVFRAGLALLLIFSVRPLDLKPEFKRFATDPAMEALSVEEIKTIRALAWKENEKAIAEIAARGAQEDTWFQYKFGLIGALLVGVTYLKLRATRGEGDKGAVTLKEFWYSPASATLLAVACVAALACDIHVRSSSCVTNQLGLWIAHYAEPMLSGQPFVADDVERFVPWEQFLRSTPAGDRDAGMHNSEMWSLTFWPHFHYLTAMIYLLYAIIFQDLCLERRRWNLDDDKKVAPLVLCIGSVFVHVGFFALAWVAHAAPEAFEFRIVPFIASSQAGGLASPLFYLIPWACLSWQQWKYLRLLFASPRV